MDLPLLLATELVLQHVREVPLGVITAAVLHFLAADRKCKADKESASVVNAIIQPQETIVVDCFSWKVMIQLVAVSLLLMGIGMHPVAGHFISEHYMFAKEFETYPYYGPLNQITLNVNYHNEHQNFRAVPVRYLPEIKRKSTISSRRTTDEDGSCMTSSNGHRNVRSNQEEGTWSQHPTT